MYQQLFDYNLLCHIHFLQIFKQLAMFPKNSSNQKNNLQILFFLIKDNCIKNFWAFCEAHVS